MEKVFEFGFGKGTQSLSLPTEQIVHEIEGEEAPALKDVAAAVKEALQNPIGTPPLKEIVKPGETVCLAVSDITRAWVRNDLLLPPLLDELNAAGIPDENIAIVIAMGSHRPHTPEEDVKVCGEEAARRVKIYQHEPKNQDQLVYVGTTSSGVELEINKRAHDADRLILLGGIVYHLIAGFGGGRKSVMPGISSYKAIQQNHSLSLSPERGGGSNPHCASSNIYNNEMNADQMECAELVNPDFLLNVTINPEGELCNVFAGHWKEAWLEGTKRVEEIYGIKIREKADLVIASAGGFPKDINLYQGSKTLDNAYYAAKPGGAIIGLLACPDIMEPPDFSGWFQYSDDLLKFEDTLRAGYTIPGYIAYYLTLMARKLTVVLVSEPQNEEFIRKAGFEFAENIEDAYEIAKKKLPENFTITVMAHGANTLPKLD